MFYALKLLFIEFRYSLHRGSTDEIKYNDIKQAYVECGILNDVFNGIRYKLINCVVHEQNNIRVDIICSNERFFYNLKIISINPCELYVHKTPISVFISIILQISYFQERILIRHLNAKLIIIMSVSVYYNPLVCKYFRN